MRALSFLILCLLVLSALEYRCVDLIQRANLPAEVDVAANILSGHPYWRAYQNRLLGPGLVAGLSRVTGWSRADAYQGVSFAMVCLANAIALKVFSRLTRSPRRAWAATVAYAGLFVVFQDPEWLYLWDFVGLTTMLLFAGAVVAGRSVPWPWMTALFAVELLNRESAQFIALWLVIDAFAWDRRDRVPLRLVDPVRLTVGMILGVSGALWTGFVRNALCVQETGVIPRVEIREFAGGQFFMLPVTLRLWREPPTLATVAFLALLGALAWLLRRTWAALGARAWKVGLLVAALTAANFCFAYVLELRVWLTMAPLLPCLACLVGSSRYAAPEPLAATTVPAGERVAAEDLVVRP